MGQSLGGLPRILVAGIGNIFFGDDAFGVEVAQRLAQRRLPENVRVVDFGIRGLDLTYALLDGHDLVILVDASRRGGEPGTLSVMEPNLAEASALSLNGLSADLETHGFVPSKALALARTMGGKFGEIRLVSCEPATLGDGEEGQMGLSAPVRNAVAEALDLIESLIHEFTRRSHEKVSMSPEHLIVRDREHAVAFKEAPGLPGYDCEVARRVK